MQEIDDINYTTKDETIALSAEIVDRKLNLIGTSAQIEALIGSMAADLGLMPNPALNVEIALKYISKWFDRTRLYLLFNKDKTISVFDEKRILLGQMAEPELHIAEWNPTPSMTRYFIACLDVEKMKDQSKDKTKLCLFFPGTGRREIVCDRFISLGIKYAPGI